MIFHAKLLLPAKRGSEKKRVKKKEISTDGQKKKKRVPGKAYYAERKGGKLWQIGLEKKYLNSASA